MAPENLVAPHSRVSQCVVYTERERESDDLAPRPLYVESLFSAPTALRVSVCVSVHRAVGALEVSQSGLVAPASLHSETTCVLPVLHPCGDAEGQRAGGRENRRGRGARGRPQKTR